MKRALLAALLGSVTALGEGGPLLNSFLNILPSDLSSLVDRISVSRQNAKPSGRNVNGRGKKGTDVPPDCSEGVEGCGEMMVGKDDLGIVNAEYVCPWSCQGTSDVDSAICECVEEREPMDNCDIGFTLDTSRRTGKVCMRPVSLKASIVCRAGSERILGGNECSSVSAFNAKMRCGGAEMGWHLRGDLCVREDSMSAVRQCPSGFAAQAATSFSSAERNKRVKHLGVEGADQICVSQRSSEAVIECPVGSRQDENRDLCLKEVYEIPLMECPPGFKPDIGTSGLCRRETPLNPQPICDDGFSLSPNSQRMLKKKPSYPFSTTLEEDQSYTAVGGDLFAVRDVIDQPEESRSVAAVTSGEIVSFSSGFDSLVDDLGECHRKHYESAIPVCREGFEFSLSERACIKVLREAPSYGCHSTGFQFDGRQCVYVEKMVAKPDCPPGFILRGKICVSQETTPAIPVCPQTGRQVYVYHAQLNRCIAVLDILPLKRCPLDMQINENDGRCYSTTSVEPSLGCSVPYQLDPHRRLCIKEVVEAAELECPADAVLYGAECRQETRFPADVVCPQNFVLYNDIFCRSEETKPIRKTCPYGFVLLADVNKCIRQYTSSGIWKCPEGMTAHPEDNSLCI